MSAQQLDDGHVQAFQQMQPVGVFDQALGHQIEHYIHTRRFEKIQPRRFPVAVAALHAGAKEAHGHHAVEFQGSDHRIHIGGVLLHQLSVVKEQTDPGAVGGGMVRIPCPIRGYVGKGLWRPGMIDAGGRHLFGPCKSAILSWIHKTLPLSCSIPTAESGKKRLAGKLLCNHQHGARRS
jgi:hypothetical protein